MPKGPTSIDPATGKQRRGFAAMDPEKRRAISAMGGAAIPAHKRTFSKDRQLASDAGRIGGQVCKKTEAA